MSSKIKISSFVLIALMITFAFISKAISDEPRKIPGITDTDKNPHSCVSCHKNYTDLKMDLRLSTIMTEWNDKVPPELVAKLQGASGEGVTLKGKHPFKATSESSIPEACFKCHGKIKTAPPLSNLLHIIHFTGGSSNKFLTMFGGECTNCHKLDLKAGKWQIMNGKESEEGK